GGSAGTGPGGPWASIIVPRAHALIFWAKSSGVTSLTPVKVGIDVTPARLAQEQAQERGRERQGRAGGERPCVRLERVDARPARDGPRPTRVQDRAERPLRERGTQEASEVHHRDRDAGEAGRIHLSAERPREHE